MVSNISFGIRDIPLIEKVGIYAIENIKNGKYYIGSATNLYERLLSHSRQIRLHCGINEKMMEDFETENDFHFIVLETFEDNEITSDMLFKKEDYYISLYNAVSNGYNSHNVNTFGRLKKGEFVKAHKRLAQITIRFPHGYLKYLEDHCAKTGESLNGYITRLIAEDMNGKNPLD